MKRTDIRIFLTGVSIGAITGLMLAPYSGKTMRVRVTGAVADGGAQVKARGETVRAAVLNAMEHTKDAITLHKVGIVGAIKRGSQAYIRAAN